MCLLLLLYEKRHSALKQEIDSKDVRIHAQVKRMGDLKIGLEVQLQTPPRFEADMSVMIKLGLPPHNLQLFPDELPSYLKMPAYFSAGKCKE